MSSKDLNFKIIKTPNLGLDMATTIEVREKDIVLYSIYARNKEEAKQLIKFIIEALNKKEYH